METMSFKKIGLPEIKKIFRGRLKTFRIEPDMGVVLVHPDNTEYLLENAKVHKRGSHVFITSGSQKIVMSLERYKDSGQTQITKSAFITGIAGVITAVIASVMELLLTTSTVAQALELNNLLPYAGVIVGFLSILALAILIVLKMARSNKWINNIKSRVATAYDVAIETSSLNPSNIFNYKH